VTVTQTQPAIMRIDTEGSLARVVSVGRNAAWIVFDHEAYARTASVPKRLERLSLVPGDRVVARPLDDDRAVVDRREPRDFSLERRTAGGRTKTMAANVDNLTIVAALEHPPLHLPMIDELLAFAELHSLRALIVFTKPDLAGPQRVAEAIAPYARIGYAARSVDPKHGDGVAELAADLSGRRSLLIGQSGVGKSSLFRALGGESTIGEVSRFGRGRQTTTSARLHRFDDGFLIDSPGVGEFALDPAVANTDAAWSAEVASGFIDFTPYIGSCRFTDCTHRVEPACAIRDAALAGAIAPSRYASYLIIVGRDGIEPAQ